MLYFLLRGVSSRQKSSRQAYNVGRQEQARSSKVNLIRAALFLVLALIFLAVVGISPSVQRLIPTPTVTPRPPATVAPTSDATLVPTATVSSTTVEPSPTSPLPTATSTPPPTLTSTPQPITATVSSGVGVWLRESPGTETEQLEWLLEGTVLIVLPGQQTVEELNWQQVQTEEGVAGWVAADFIVINEPQ
jgi:hypothetical protein